MAAVGKKTSSAALLLGCWLAASAPAEPWRSEVLMQSDHGMGGVAVGDLDQETPGDEVAVGTEAGEAWVVRRVEGRWKAERVHAGDGELIMCAIGDVDPRLPGNELVGAGMVEGPESPEGPGQVVLIARQGGAWSSRPIFRDDHMIHGVGVGDVAARHEGCEVIAAGFNHRVQLVYLDGDSWSHETIYVANDRLKVVLAADALPDRPGLELLATGSDGKPQVLWEGGLGWHHQTVYADRLGQSRITAGDLGVLIGSDGGQVTLAQRKEGRWQTECLGRDSAKIRGVVLADLDPACPGPEAYACGYSGRVTQYVRTSDVSWEARIIHSQPRPLHHLVAGDFDPRHPGPELVTCGHGGLLIALYPGE